MSQVVIRVRDHGPLVVEGGVTIIGADGKAFSVPSDKPDVALCRCGASRKKPYCDGAHKGCGFLSAPRASDMP